VCVDGDACSHAGIPKPLSLLIGELYWNVTCLFLAEGLGRGAMGVLASRASAGPK
jgi:hypothetical protein